MYVEPDGILTTETEGNYSLLPYRERRLDWGYTAALAYSSYEPVNYEPNFAPPVEFVDIYSTPETPMIEFELTVKRNYKGISVGVEAAIGIYTNRSDEPDISDSTLTLVPIRVGGILFIDSIGKEPWLVPYAAAGAYTMNYSESTETGSGFGGTTQAAPYFRGGVQMMLDWLDRPGSRLSYRESGIEATYAYAEARKQMTSSAEKDPDFEGDISWAAGVRVEF